MTRHKWVRSGGCRENPGVWDNGNGGMIFYPTLRAARHAIRLRARGSGRYGQWTPDGAVTAYHESRQVGCGGYAIAEVA